MRNLDFLVYRHVPSLAGCSGCHQRLYCRDVLPSNCCKDRQVLLSGTGFFSYTDRQPSLPTIFNEESGELSGCPKIAVCHAARSLPLLGIPRLFFKVRRVDGHHERRYSLSSMRSSWGALKHPASSCHNCDDCCSPASSAIVFPLVGCKSGRFCVTTSTSSRPDRTYVRNICVSSNSIVPWTSLLREVCSR